MNLRWTPIAWSAVYLLFLLSFVTPFSLITIFVMLVPGVILYTTLSLRAFLLHVGVVWAVAFVLLLDPLILLTAAVFVVPVLVMGHLYKLKASALKVVAAGTGTLLGEGLLGLLVITAFFDFHLATSIENFLNIMAAPLQNMANSPFAANVLWSPEMSQQISSLVVRVTPVSLVLSSLMLAAITHTIARPTLSSMGHPVQGFPPLREWRLPRALIWYYLISSLITMFSGPEAMQGSIGTMLLNLLLVLNFLFMIQAASFIFFLAYEKKWNPAIPVLFIIAMLLFSPLKIVGILDIAAPLREMITRSRR
ncbi:DUF2232 domain-containing protein [Paenibacillus fonticola]|uniref:DUF2232 domain-containing protein n=1 Tax=Paenibacillus fonticola TaxID=379896 RepID=UPI000376A791|nr:DUF2232 domain-containing protein [Paenibacillus fonticola]